MAILGTAREGHEAQIPPFDRRVLWSNGNRRVAAVVHRSANGPPIPFVDNSYRNRTRVDFHRLTQNFAVAQGNGSSIISSRRKEVDLIPPRVNASDPAVFIDGAARIETARLRPEKRAAWDFHRGVRCL